MRNVFLVCYDVCDDKRLRKVYKTMRGYGDHLQFSVFRCELSARERAQMIADLSPIIDHGVDQVLVVDIGPAEGRASLVFESIGRAYMAPERLALVV
ncbi:MAG: CRISPR-associated endonuclease Cas2 [Deltaproteobacteria bacterium]|nr:CRISPR-associated endonuclease Cas2 [Deltaproteobacteria bacterium]